MKKIVDWIVCFLWLTAYFTLGSAIKVPVLIVHAVYCSVVNTWRELSRESGQPEEHDPWSGL